MSVKRALFIVLVASGVMLAVGTEPTRAVSLASKPSLSTVSGPVPNGVPWLAQSAKAGAFPTSLSSPILGLFINIWVDTVDNTNPAVAYNSVHDEYLVVWQNDQGGGTWDVYARRVDGDGTLLSNFTVATNVGKKNWQPDVAYNPVEDEYLIVYTYEVSGTDYDVYARLVKWNGADLGLPRYAEFAINIDSGIQQHPAVAYNSQSDEYLVVYDNWWSSTLHDVDARRVDKDGTALGGASGVNIATGANQLRHFPDVAYNAARNEYLIVYGYNPYGSSNGGIRGKVAAHHLGTLSSEKTICDDSYDQDFPAVAAGPDEYLVVWEDGTWSTNDYDIYGRRVSGDGTPQGSSGGFSIAGSGDGNLHVDPAVGYGRGYGYLVAWRYYEGGSDQNVYGRYVMPGQDAAAGSEFAIDDDTNTQGSPAVACDSQGDCLVVEEDNWPGADYEIRGRFVMPYHLYLPLALRNYQ
jgi:uncharacterized protein YlbG (UPF0298 family)